MYIIYIINIINRIYLYSRLLYYLETSTGRAKRHIGESLQDLRVILLLLPHQARSLLEVGPFQLVHRGRALRLHLVTPK